MSASTGNSSRGRKSDGFEPAGEFTGGRLLLLLGLGAGHGGLVPVLYILPGLAIDLGVLLAETSPLRMAGFPNYQQHRRA